MQLTYDVAGHGRPVVFVHGWLSSRRIFGYQLYGLAPECRVLAVDLPGYGTTPWDPGVSWLEQAAGGLAKLCAGLPEPPIVVGWSLGATVARTASAEVPDCRLVLVGAGRSAPSEGVSDSMRAQVTRDLPRFARTMARSFSAGASPETEEWLFQMAAAVPVAVAVASIPGPIGDAEPPKDAVVVHGAFDQVVRVDDRLLGADGTGVQFSRSGHAPFLDEKDRFNQLIIGVAKE